MRFTIIPSTGFVSIDGLGYGGLVFEGPEGVHAVQWYGDSGEVELLPTELDPTMNVTIESYDIFQPALDAWQVKHTAATAPPPPPPTPSPEELEAQALIQIDKDVDFIFRDAVGQRVKEYEIREAEARAYVAAGYTGTAGPYLMDYVNASNMTEAAAADDVIVQAEAWLSAHKAMSTQRLLAKAGVRSGAVGVTMESWAGFVNQLRAALGLAAV